MKIEFTVWGDPVGQARPRFTRTGRVYDPATSRKYKVHVANIAKQAMEGHEPSNAAILVAIDAYIAMPKSWSKRKRETMNGLYAVAKPDDDNIAKIILDGMIGICYKDDKQVSAMCVKKRWAAEGHVDVVVADL